MVGRGGGVIEYSKSRILGQLKRKLYYCAPIYGTIQQIYLTPSAIQRVTSVIRGDLCAKRQPDLHIAHFQLKSEPLVPWVMVRFHSKTLLETRATNEVAPSGSNTF